mmetsp:Transcript_3544/g.8436  ORF Transcript_3544/g.8436 Transcript_3544/m.8436 type:complete len:401 (+) Transcript_3544:270-1472(+)
MIAKRALTTLALAVSVSLSASAFTSTGPFVRNNGVATTSTTAKSSVATKRSPLQFQSKNGVSTPTALALSADTAGGAKAEEPAAGGLAETLQVAMYFALWYLFNIAYNIYNKQALNVLDYPWTIATIQMATGILYFGPLWLTGLRKAPKLSVDEMKTLLPIALCHTGVHVGAVIALGAGAVSFAHIVKASEPVVTCGMNFALLGEVLPLPVYLTLIPIIGGVAIASMKELSFTVLALASAMLSNVSSSARGVLSKKTMSGKKVGENMDAQNLYAVLTAMSTVILIPFMLALEGLGMFKSFGEVVKAGDFTRKGLATLLALGGASYYAYNEVAFLALGKVNPVTHAVGNTIKRVVIIVASVIAFKTPMSTGSIIGSSIAIAGTLLYSLAMNASKKPADKKK